MLHYDFTFLLFLLSSIIAIGVAVIITKDKKKVQPAFAKPPGISPANLVQSAHEPEFMPALIDRPLLELTDSTEIFVEGPPAIESKFMPVDDKESALLKAAEIVVEKVQDVINHIASYPPNPEEVTSKIRAIVNPYTIFRNTEYFDAINSFIAITVERDCDINLTKEQLLSLWD